MTRDETKILINSIMVCYQKNLMPELSKEMIDMWYTLLQDLVYKEAITAVAALISESPNYPPTIGQIRGKLASAKINSMTDVEAFSLIREAVRKFGSYRKDDAVAWLGDELGTIVNRYGWEYWCNMPRDNITTYTAQFRRMWEGLAEEKLSQARIPDAVKRQLEAMRPKQTAPCLDQQTHMRNLEATYNKMEEENK